jgi:hypothetical protein
VRKKKKKKKNQKVYLAVEKNFDDDVRRRHSSRGMCEKRQQFLDGTRKNKSLLKEAERLSRGFVEALMSDELFHAVDRRDEERVRTLLQSGSGSAASSVNRVDASSNKHALFVACEDGNAALVALLLAHGADANATCTRAHSTPLHAAAYHARGAADVITALVERGGASPNVANANGSTPLHAACSVAQLDSVRALVSHGASLAAADRTGGATPLHYAAAQHEPAIVEALLAADRRAATLCDKAGLEPAHYAAADLASGGDDVARRDLSRVLDLLAAAGSRAAAQGLAALKRTLQDAPDAHRRHIAQVARRDVPAPRVPASASARPAPAAAAPAKPAPAAAAKTPEAPVPTSDELLSQMPSVPGMRKPPKRSDGPEEYAALFDQRGSVASKAPATDSKLVFVPGDYQEVEGAALPMLGVPDSPPGSPAVGKLTAKLRGLRKKDDAPAAAGSAADEPAKKESISARMKRLKEMAREKLTKSNSGKDKTVAAAAAGAAAYDDGGTATAADGGDDDNDEMSFPDAPGNAGGAAAYVDTAVADFPAAPPRVAPQRQAAAGNTGGAAAYNDNAAATVDDFPSAPPQRQPVVAEPGASRACCARRRRRRLCVS